MSKGRDLIILMSFASIKSFINDNAEVTVVCPAKHVEWFSSMESEYLVEIGHV
ncbi:MAG: hypothetical protein JW779_12185 [Candidatus Thorarchaeota archaeon]|nr:hypothetical protein [Candidatus Thorarchaeota archaeon]